MGFPFYFLFSGVLGVFLFLSLFLGLLQKGLVGWLVEGREETAKGGEEERGRGRKGICV